MINLAMVMRRRTARSKSHTSGRVLGSNWDPRMKKRRVSKRIANNFTILVVRQLALALERKKIISGCSDGTHLILPTPYLVCAMP